MSDWFLVQPTAARRAFPCWDEPSIKATFAITMISRVDTTALSNMPVISEELVKVEPANDDNEILAPLLSGLSLNAEDRVQDQWKITRFMTTPLVSSIKHRSQT